MANYIVVAASSDIGYETLKNLKNNGDSFYITSRNADRLSELKSEFDCNGGILDATDFDAMDNMFKAAMEDMGSVEGVVCYAGSVSLKPAHLVSFDDYMETIHTSLTTSFATVRSAGKFLKKGGSVVLISSAAAMQGISNHEAIAAAKGGVISLAKSAASTYAGKNIRFNVVAPGLTETKLTEKITGNEASLKYSLAMHALGRIANANHVADMVTYLLSDKADIITGQVIAVDAGLSNLQPKIKV